jgi:hypothetical protein
MASNVKTAALAAGPIGAGVRTAVNSARRFDIDAVNRLAIRIRRSGRGREESGSLATAIDRNVWQYLADATRGAYDPALDTSDVREERLAALRIVLHTPSILCVTPSVHAEFERIGDPGRWRENAGMRDVFIRVVRPCDLDSGLVETRTRVLQAHHADPDDCRVVAKAEAARVSRFLTLDRHLVQHLTSHTTLMLTQPSAFWRELRVPQGANPWLSPAPR